MADFTDSERYRWMRVAYVDFDDDEFNEALAPLGLCYTPEEVDAAIDGELAKPENAHLLDEAQPQPKGSALSDEQIARAAIQARIPDEMAARFELRSFAHAIADLAAQAPAPVAGQVIKLGSYGQAFDLAGDRRAYTYKHQPGNQAAWRIGDASSRVEAGGDLIDRGLSLLKVLEAGGFGVFELDEAATVEAPAVGDEMLEPLVYAAIMHDGMPKTVAEFERAAANVADMLERRAAAQPLPEALPHPGSPEADNMLDALLAEYGHPANAKNAARAGYMAARRLLQHARHPLPASAHAEPVGLGGTGWQPIETAPQDTQLLLAAEFDRPGDWRIKMGYFDSKSAKWAIWGASWRPTRWMPLPAAPGSHVPVQPMGGA